MEEQDPSVHRDRDDRLSPESAPAVRSGVAQFIANGTTKKTGRRYVFTSFGSAGKPLPSPESRQQEISDWFSRIDRDKCLFIIFQTERCPDTGRTHFQGYVVFKNDRNYKSVHEFLPWGSWVFKAGGTHEQCIAYCSKESTRIDGPFECGTRPSTASLTAEKPALYVKRRLFAQDPVDAILESDVGFSFVIRHYKNLLSVENKLRKPEEGQNRQVIVQYGGTGLGKTYASTRGSHFMVPRPRKGGTLWFDNYDGEDSLVFDEFDGSFIQPTEFNLLCDSTQYQLPIKGGFKWLRSPILWFNTNHRPDTWWPKSKTPFDSHIRRVSEFRLYATSLGVGKHLAFKRVDGDLTGIHWRKFKDACVEHLGFEVSGDPSDTITTTLTHLE